MTADARDETDPAHRPVQRPGQDVGCVLCPDQAWPCTAERSRRASLGHERRGSARKETMPTAEDALLRVIEDATHDDLTPTQDRAIRDAILASGWLTEREAQARRDGAVEAVEVVEGFRDETQAKILAPETDQRDLLSHAAAWGALSQVAYRIRERTEQAHG